MQALYRGEDDTARQLAKDSELDVFEAAALGDAARLSELLDADSNAGARAFGRRLHGPSLCGVFRRARHSSTAGRAWSRCERIR